MSKVGRAPKYPFDLLLEIDAPAFGFFTGNVLSIRVAASQWAKRRGRKIKTKMTTMDGHPGIEIALQPE